LTRCSAGTDTTTLGSAGKPALLMLAGHPLAGRASVDIEELADHDVIWPHAAAAAGIEWVPARTPSGRPVRRIRREGRHVESIVTAIEDGNLLHITFAVIADVAWNWVFQGTAIVPVTGAGRSPSAPSGRPAARRQPSPASPEPAPAPAPSSAGFTSALLVTMDLSVLFLAVPKLRSRLDPSRVRLPWITDSYGFLIAGSLLMMGNLSRRVKTGFACRCHRRPRHRFTELPSGSTTSRMSRSGRFAFVQDRAALVVQGWRNDLQAAIPGPSGLAGRVP
jgi:hypothetical protein